MSSTRSSNKVVHARKLFDTIRAKDGQHGDTYVNLPINLPPLSVSWISKIANSPAKDRGYTRTYYSYPAKFQAHLPNGLISHSTRPGDLVCDPYCGGGTTGLESMLLDRNFAGYDLSPFAILISRVKTTKLATDKIADALPEICRIRTESSKSIFDNGDRECLGADVADELESIAFNIESYIKDCVQKDFLKLALIHTVKIVGRRDFTTRGVGKADLFNNLQSRSAVPIFKNKVTRMLMEMEKLPNPKYKPRFVCASNHNMELDDNSVDLIVTSPPYKDLDVEYALIQLQRRELNRSKRSEVIFRILGSDFVNKDTLCGDKGDSYWNNLAFSLKECKRVLKRRHLAFFWIGFKSQLDRDIFCVNLNEYGLSVQSIIPVRLGHDRVASSRSTHHGRNTGMLKRDCMIIARA